MIQESLTPQVNTPTSQTCQILSLRYWNYQVLSLFRYRTYFVRHWTFYIESLLDTFRILSLSEIKLLLTSVWGTLIDYRQNHHRASKECFEESRRGWNCFDTNFATLGRVEGLCELGGREGLGRTCFVTQFLPQGAMRGLAIISGYDGVGCTARYLIGSVWERFSVRLICSLIDSVTDRLCIWYFSVSGRLGIW